MSQENDKNITITSPARRDFLKVAGVTAAHCLTGLGSGVDEVRALGKNQQRGPIRINAAPSRRSRGKDAIDLLA